MEFSNSVGNIPFGTNMPFGANMPFGTNMQFGTNPDSSSTFGSGIQNSIPNFDFLNPTQPVNRKYMNNMNDTTDMDVDMEDSNGYSGDATTSQPQCFQCHHTAYSKVCTGDSNNLLTFCSQHCMQIYRNKKLLFQTQNPFPETSGKMDKL